ncbi:hypothetical protein CPB85DRAFT_1364221, partial [Mucidula mucida]
SGQPPNSLPFNTIPLLPNLSPIRPTTFSHTTANPASLTTRQLSSLNTPLFPSTPASFASTNIHTNNLRTPTSQLLTSTTRPHHQH